eukprot:COSAG01_NODE_2402_length_7759_cov_9.960313_1_plen_56_part_00
MHPESIQGCIRACRTSQLLETHSCTIRPQEEADGAAAGPPVASSSMQHATLERDR